MLIMQAKQKKTVCGFMRINFGDEYPLDIIKIIYEYYVIRIASNILTSSEQIALLDLLYEKLSSKYESKNVSSIDTALLFRVSENGFNSAKFNEFCANKGPTILIIHNEYDRVFGGCVGIMGCREI